MSTERRGKPVVIPQATVEQIRTRWALQTAHAWGAQKALAYDLGVSPSYVNQIIRGWRRKAA